MFRSKSKLIGAVCIALFGGAMILSHQSAKASEGPFQGWYCPQGFCDTCGEVLCLKDVIVTPQPR